MFRGEYQHAIDPKGRVIMPSKLREGLGENFIVTKGFDGCLFVYSIQGWSKFEAGLNALPQANPDARAIVRFFFAGAVECEVDKQGRIVIPQNLRDYAKINGDVYIIGASGRVEIWNKEKWEEYSGNISADPNTLAQNLTDMGICF